MSCRCGHPDCDLPLEPATATKGTTMTDRYTELMAQRQALIDDGVPEGVLTMPLPEPELLPGYVVLRCPDCDATAVGRPSESIEHAEDGAHVHHMTYGGGA